MVDEDDYDNEFEAMTECLTYEKIYDRLADRAEFVRVLAMHCADIYKSARQGGLPRKTARAMAMGYFDYETTPSGFFVGRVEG